MTDEQRPTLHPKKRIFVPPKATNKEPNTDNNVQDKFLKNILFKKIEVKLDLANDTTLEGVITKFDRYTLTINVQGNDILVYKAYIVMMTGVEQND